MPVQESAHAERAAAFLALHRSERPLLLPNAWDQGSARLLASLGFRSLATTSAGFATTLGRLDGRVTREEALAHAALIADATDLPVSADLENGFADDPDGVAATVRAGLDAGLSGLSIEDFSRDPQSPIYELSLAKDRIAAAAEAAHRGPVRLVLTARAENYLHGRSDLGDTIERLQAYEEAGADVLFAPGLRALSEIREVVGALRKPLSVLALPGVPGVKELAEAGVCRVSVGQGFATVSYGAAVEAARELLEQGTYDFTKLASVGAEACRQAFGA